MSERQIDNPQERIEMRRQQLGLLVNDIQQLFRDAPKSIQEQAKDDVQLFLQLKGESEQSTDALFQATDKGHEILRTYKEPIEKNANAQADVYQLIEKIYFLLDKPTVNTTLTDDILRFLQLKKDKEFLLAKQLGEKILLKESGADTLQELADRVRKILTEGPWLEITYAQEAQMNQPIESHVAQYSLQYGIVFQIKNPYQTTQQQKQPPFLTFIKSATNQKDIGDPPNMGDISALHPTCRVFIKKETLVRENAQMQVKKEAIFLEKDPDPTDSSIENKKHWNIANKTAEYSREFLSYVEAGWLNIDKQTYDDFISQGHIPGALPCKGISLIHKTFPDGEVLRMIKYDTKGKVAQPIPGISLDGFHIFSVERHRTKNLQESGELQTTVLKDAVKPPENPHQGTYDAEHAERDLLYSLLYQSHFEQLDPQLLEDWQNTQTYTFSPEEKKDIQTIQRRKNYAANQNSNEFPYEPNETLSVLEVRFEEKTLYFSRCNVLKKSIKMPAFLKKMEKQGGFIDARYKVYALEPPNKEDSSLLTEEESVILPRRMKEIPIETEKSESNTKTQNTDPYVFSEQNPSVREIPAETEKSESNTKTQNTDPYVFSEENPATSTKPSQATTESHPAAQEQTTANHPLQPTVPKKRRFFTRFGRKITQALSAVALFAGINTKATPDMRGPDEDAQSTQNNIAQRELSTSPFIITAPTGYKTPEQQVDTTQKETPQKQESSQTEKEQAILHKQISVPISSKGIRLSVRDALTQELQTELSRIYGTSLSQQEKDLIHHQADQAVVDAIISARKLGKDELPNVVGKGKKTNIDFTLTWENRTPIISELTFGEINDTPANEPTNKQFKEAPQEKPKNVIEEFDSGTPFTVGEQEFVGQQLRTYTSKSGKTQTVRVIGKSIVYKKEMVGGKEQYIPHENILLKREKGSQFALGATKENLDRIAPFDSILLKKENLLINPQKEGTVLTLVKSHGPGPVSGMGMYEALETFFAYQNSAEQNNQAKKEDAIMDRIATEQASGDIPVYDKGKLIGKKRLRTIRPFRGTTITLDSHGIISRVDLRK